MPRTAFAFCLLGLAALSCTPEPAAATTYTFAPLAGTAGLDNVIPTGINNAGTVIGVYGPGNQPRTGFVDQAGQVSSFVNNPLLGINDRGDIVGTLFTLLPTFVEQSTFTGPDAAPGITLPDVPAGINNSVTVVGNVQGSGAYIYQSGTVTPVNFPGTSFNTVAGISNSGTVVGRYQDVSGDHTFLETAGVYTTIDVPGLGASIIPTGVNNLGQVVGYYNVPAAPFERGFVEQNGVFQDFSLGSQAAIPAEINDSGVITGWYYGGESRHFGPVSAGAFIATPDATDVPEPASLALFAAALAGAGLLRRRN